jgi:thiopurine S-methyltransferase
MEKEFWITRWAQQEIGFHLPEVNPHLLQHWTTLTPHPNHHVFVPLCGKSRDMVWLRQQGCTVLGVELSDLAVTAFFAENGHTPQAIPHPSFDSHEADGIRLLCGDFFDLTPEDMADVTVVYDRASMVALPPDMRTRYVQHLIHILPAGAQILLVTFDYPQAAMSGPPFAVSPDEVLEHYRAHADVRLLAQQDVLAENPRFQQRGIDRLFENIFLIRKY